LSKAENKIIPLPQRFLLTLLAGGNFTLFECGRRHHSATILPTAIVPDPMNENQPEPQDNPNSQKT
jgi:hypothetical protein